MQRKIPTIRSSKNAWILFALIAVSFALRILFFSDMEYKADEKVIVQYISGIWDRPFNPLAPVSNHGGVAHSAGFFYFLSAISFGSSNPLHTVLSVIFFNVLTVTLGLWVFRKKPTQLLAFALCGTSMVLIILSRKIWTPDVLAPWVFLFFVLFIKGLERKQDLARNIMIGASGFLLVMGGHMYLPGGLVAAIVTCAAFFWLWFRERKLVLPWFIGCTLGWATFIPWLLLMLARAPGTTTGNSTSFEMAQLWPILRAALTIPSPSSIYSLFIKPWLDWLNQYASGPVLWFTLFWTWLASFATLALFWWSLFRAAKYRKELFKDPVALFGITLLILTPVALFLVRLGTYLHYWLSVVPFLFYVMAWASNLQPDSRASLWMKRLAWSTCLLSAIAALHFILLVHQVQGLPGEYGPAYSAQQRNPQP